MQYKPETDIIPYTDTNTGMVVVDDAPLYIAWEQAKERWLATKEAKSGRRNTRIAYEVAHRQFFDWSMIEPWRVSSGMVQEWVADMRARGLAESTVALKLAALSSFYDFVQRRYSFTTRDGREIALWPADRTNPFQAVERPHVSPYGRAQFPTVDEAKLMLAQINSRCVTGARDFGLFFTILTTCRRFSEIINLRWGDIEPRPDGDYQFRYVYKGGKPRRAVLPKTCYQAICHYLELDGRPPAEMQPEALVFIAIRPEIAERLPHIDRARVDQPISNSQANRSLKKYARKAGVDLVKAHIHGLRHAGARLRKQRMKETGKGVDYEELMLVLGHSSIAVTQIYSQTVLEDPEDPGAADAAAQWMPSQRRRRKAKLPKPEQESF